MARSYRDHHPHHEFVLVVLDDAEATDAEHQIVTAESLGIDRTRYHRLATAYAGDELVEAVTPLVLERLLTRAPVVVRLAHDGRVFAPFPEVADLASTEDIVLTPRVLEPLPRDGLAPDDVALADAGTFDLGFVAVGRGAGPFLDLWRDQALRGSTVAAQPRPAADRWADRVPALFRHAVLRDPGINLTYWNAHERRLHGTADGTITANGEPLRFARFTGYDPDQPWLLSTRCQTRRRVVLSDHAELRELCDSYAEDLRAAGHDATHGLDRFGSFPDGTPLTMSMRRVFHSAWLEAQHARANRKYKNETVPPTPFDDDNGLAFKRWLTEPGTPQDEVAGLNRLVRWVWKSRPDLQGAFPRPGGDSAMDFRNWCREFGPDEGIPTWAAPREPAPVQAPVDEFGVNIAGYLTAELGLGEMGRVVHGVALQADIPLVSVVEEESISSRTALEAPATVGRPRFPISLLCVNADFTDLLLTSHPEVGYRRYRIGLWAWELEDFPASLHGAFQLVDEVWTVSDFCRTAIAQHSPVPVKVVPVPVADPGAAPRAPRRPSEPVQFLFAFDFNSTAGRKNPWGLVTAFQRAFPGRADVRLVIKATNGDLHVPAAERLRRDIGSDSRIQLLDRYLTVAELDELYATSHAYVSLHRSEGFGLTVAEAMVRGMPVIATNYSATTELFDETVGWAVPYRMVEVGPGWHPYQADAVWADPDLDAAARAMREVADNPLEAARRGKAAREHVLRTRPVGAAADWMRTQLESAYRSWQAHGGVGFPTSGLAREVVEPLRRAREALHWQADTAAASRIPFAPALRRAVLRAIDHYDAHQRKVLGAITDGMGDALEVAGDRLDDAVRSQARRMDAAESATEDQLTDLTARLERLERAVEALRKPDNSVDPPH